MKMLIEKTRLELLSLAQNPNLTIAEQFQLATYQDGWRNRAVREPSIAMILAKNPNLDEQVQQLLLKQNMVVRRNLAENLGVIENIQLQLIDYAIEHSGIEIMVIWALVKNPTISEIVQRKLLTYPFQDTFDETYLYKMLAKNPSTSSDVFSEIENYLPRDFLRHITTIDNIEEEEGGESVTLFGSNVLLSEEEQWLLFRSQTLSSHIKLARQANLLEEIQYALLEQDDKLILSFLADNRYLCDDVKDKVFELRLIYL